MFDLKLNTMLNIANEEVTVEDFMEIENLGFEEAVRQLEFMLSRDLIKIVPVDKTDWETLMAEVNERMTVEDKVEINRRDEEVKRQNSRLEANKNSYLHEEVKIKYSSLLTCQDDAKLFFNKLGLKEAPEIYEAEDGSGYILLLRNISEQEYMKINRKIQVDDAVEGTVEFAEKVIGSVGDSIDFTAKNLLTPTAKITAMTAGKIGKTVGTTTLKAGANLINSSARALKEGKAELSNDGDMLLARQELNNLGNSLKNLFGLKKKSSRMM